MEFSVLASGRELIERYRPVLMIEIISDFLQRKGASIQDLEQFLRGFGYHFFCNIGERGGDVEDFELARLFSALHPVGLFDLVAIHPDDKRYPSRTASGWPLLLSWLVRRVRTAPGGLMRRLTRS